MLKMNGPNPRGCQDAKGWAPWAILGNPHDPGNSPPTLRGGRLCFLFRGVPAFTIHSKMTMDLVHVAVLYLLIFRNGTLYM